MSPEQTLDYLNVTPEDRPDALRLLQAPVTPAVEQVLAHLTARLGSSDDSNPALGSPAAPVTEFDWLTAMLHFVPEIVAWHSDRGIPEATSRATLADFGRQMAINRRVHQRFGVDTYKWLNHVFSGRIYQLGRLQYLIHQPAAQIPGVSPDEWILGIHIPEDGGLSAEAVAHSLALAAPFFAEHFPEKPVRTANCESWLLDPTYRHTWPPPPISPNSPPASPRTANPTTNPPTPCTSPSAHAVWRTWLPSPGRRRCNRLS